MSRANASEGIIVYTSNGLSVILTFFCLDKGPSHQWKCNSGSDNCNTLELCLYY